MIEPYYQEKDITIYCADCRDVLPQLEPVDLVLTDPPYGMNYNTNGNRFTLGGRNLPPIVGDNKQFDPSPWLLYKHCVLWGFNHYPAYLPGGGAYVWIKRTDLAFGCFLSDAEIAWVKDIKGVYCYRDTEHAISCVRQHPAEKPVGLMKFCILKSNSEGTILDPFMGSGTTLRAAKDLGRKAIGIEIEKKYCDIAIERLMQGVLI
jgi:site-specific DNA-methyltransferase (adenine-specific)